MPDQPPPAGLAEVVDELYVLPPADFTARRDARAAEARAGGDKALAAAVRGLRRPTASAWALNLLSREEAGLLDQLLEVGASLRQAQDGLDGAAMKELNEQRRGVVGALARRAGDLAREHGQALDAAMSRQVEQSLAAALAEPEAGAAVSSGQLTRPVEASGFGFSLDPEAMAVPSLVLVQGGKAGAGRPAGSRGAARPAGKGTSRALDGARERSERRRGEVVRNADEAEREGRSRREAEEAERARLEAEEAEEAEQERRRAEAEAALQAAREAVEEARAAQAEAQREAEDAAAEVDDLRGLETERGELRARLAEVEEEHAGTATALAEQQGRQEAAADEVTAAGLATKAAEKALRALQRRS